MRMVVVAVGLLLVSACGSPRGFIEPTTTDAPLVARELDATFELPGIEYEMDYPSAWTPMSFGSVSTLSGTPGDEALDGAVREPVLLFEYLSVEEIAGFGVGTSPSPRDLAALNMGQFGLAETDDVADRVVGAAPAATFRSTDQHGNRVLTVQGVLNGFAYRLFLYTADANQLEAHLGTWEAMISSIRPSG